MIQFRGIRFSYRAKEPALVVDELDLPPGLTLVVGPNGAGKSTLLRLAAGVDRPTRGAVTVEGFDLWQDEAEARHRLAYVPEQPDLTPYATIAQVLRLVADLRGLSLEAVATALVRVDLTTAAHRTIRELSMGQRRRVLVAAALIGHPPILILDEPLETMDAFMRALLLDLVSERRAAGGTIVIATHELEPFAAETDVVLSVRDGRVHVDATSGLSAAERLALLSRAARGDPSLDIPPRGI